MKYDELQDYPCSIVRPLSVLGDRWTFIVVKQAFAGSRRFEDFREALGISRGRLTDRLNRLVEEGILRREPYQSDGGRTRDQYRLTEKGRELYPVLIAIKDWGDRYMAPEGPPVHYRHRDCGGEAHADLRCERCGAPLAAHDVEPQPGPGLEPYVTGARTFPPAA